MASSEIVLVAAVAVLYALVSRRATARSVTMPMVLVGAGWALGAAGLVEVEVDRETLTLVAELTLVVILFGDAVRVDPARLRRYLGRPTRLLLIGLPLSVGFGTLVGSVVMPALTVAQVALIAAILAPTDAALGAAVVEDPAVPAADRLSLNVESGVNDGLVVPIVAVLTAIVIDEQRSGGEWTRFVVEQIGLGVLVGAVLGAAAIRVLTAVHVRGWSDGRYEQLATFAVPVIALFGAEAVGGNSFIAAFVAGLAFGAGGIDRTESHAEGRASHFAEFTEDAAQLLAVIAFFLFGNVFVDDAMSAVDARVVVLSIATLTIVRIGPVWLSLIGTGTRWPTRLFIGWFGPRGLASIVFALLLLEEAAELGDVADDVFAVIATTVVFSVVLHGVSAAPAARRYGVWAARADRPDDDMMDMSDDVMPPPRWSAEPG